MKGVAGATPSQEFGEQVSIVKVRKTRTERRSWEWNCTRCPESDWGFRAMEFAVENASEHALHHMREILRERDAMADMLTYIAIHVGRYQWKVLTTEQKELWADLIDADHTIQDEQANYVGTDMAYTPVERWWRD